MNSIEQKNITEGGIESVRGTEKGVQQETEVRLVHCVSERRAEEARTVSRRTRTSIGEGAGRGRSRGGIGEGNTARRRTKKQVEKESKQI